MDAIVELIGQQVVGIVVGMVLVGGPVLIRFGLMAAKEAAKKTETPLDDEIVAQLLKAAEAKGRRDAESGKE